MELDIRNNQNMNKYYICAVYIPPPVQKHMLKDFLDNANRILESHNNTLILGDFNLSSVSWPSNTNTVPLSDLRPGPLGTMLLDFVALNNLGQYNTVLNNQERILDLVLSTEAIERVRESRYVLSNIDPYHPPLEFELSCGKPTHLLPKVCSGKVNFHKADYAKISSELNSVLSDREFLVLANVDDMVDLLYRKIKEAIAKHAPLSKTTNRELSFLVYYKT